ncbi:hypothetical protein TMatcc_006250 [Talaromyces marneffei ATCC 18224]|uniref:Uncharacterized protein n=3 Tax=Talaromyces marneffei TaxID=37727 RepID=B6QBW1_TALMQ|nr:uncharacterized protein EYB26_002794 [Talaromyces marneffei]EEA25521.1 conserved hypothetical protein [Talaromyces marneffei ATCC 18224]KAE8554243.1 hypothetical protein EYB25_002781 [Talaromyces marneffei]QGA15138.1 hypothetical protein EYB26_002794 [Talaromyces marneffei]
MAPKKAGNPMEDSWVVSDIEPSTYSQPVIVEGTESAPASFPIENLSPVSSFSESELIQDYEEEDPPISVSASDLPNPAESTATLASSESSGPELIMPSIMFETRASDHGSWVIPRKRSRQSLYESRKAPRIPKPRSQTSSQERQVHPVQKKDTVPAAALIPDTSMRHYFSQVKDYFSEDINRYQFFRLILNSLLVLMTMHLLIFPELVHQVPILCKVPGVSNVYSQTCAKSNSTITEIPSPSASYQSAVRTQNQLQNYLNQTIQDMVPLDVSLKDTDTILRAIYTDVRREYSSARHEIELEFDGARAASRSISRALMKLKVDMKSTVHGFQAPTHRLEYLKGAARNSRKNADSIFSRLTGRKNSKSDSEEDSGMAAMNQFARLSQELDSIIARLAQKTHILLEQLAKLDDHLQSIEQLSVREQDRINSKHAKDQKHNIWSSLNDIIQVAKSSESTNHDKQENTILEQLGQVALYHNLMADVVGKLDRELKALQKIRSIRT